MKLLLVVVSVCVSMCVHSQTLSVLDVQKILANPTDNVDRYLLSVGFALEGIRDADKKISVRTYRKGLTEAVYAGSGLYKKDGTLLKNVVYLTTDTRYMVEMIQKIPEAGFRFKNKTSDADGNDTAFFENDYFTVMLSIDYRKGQNSSIMLSEK